MAKWKCEICGSEFENFHAQGFNHKIYCPLCFFKKKNQELKKQLEEKDILIKQCELSVSNVMDCYCERTDCSGRIKDSKKYDSLVQVQETQQKEFIKYLEDEIQKKREKSATLTAYRRNVVPLQQCLQKYKEIIGDDK